MSKLRFPEFRDSVRVEKLGNVTQWFSGGTPPKSVPAYWGGDTPWISASSMRGSSYSKSDRTLTPEGVKNGSRIAKKGSILLLVRGSMLFNKIPVGIAEVDVAFNQDVKAVTSQSVDMRYLLYFFQASEHKLLSKVVGTGIGAGKLELDDLLSMQIAMPSLQEQKKIAEFLTAVESKITRIRIKKDLLHRYKKGVMQAIFSQRLRFNGGKGSTYPDWGVKRFSDIYTLLHTNSLSRSELDAGGKDGVKNIHYGDIHTKLPQFVDLSQASLPAIKDIAIISSASDFCQKGDIIIADASEDYTDIGKTIEITNVGNNKVVAGLHTFLARPRLNLVVYGYSSFALRSDVVRRQIVRIATGASVLGIAKTNLLKVMIPLPARDEQQRIVELLSALDSRIRLTEKELEQARAFKTTLLKWMFYSQEGKVHELAVR